MIEPTKDYGQQLPVPEEKAIGFVNSREQLDEVTAALNAAGYPNSKLVALYGEDGIEMLERLRDVAFFGDWERAVVDRAITELNLGHYSLAVAVNDREEAMRVASIATPRGAHSFNYFGTWVNEQLTK